MVVLDSEFTYSVALLRRLGRRDVFMTKRTAVPDLSIRPCAYLFVLLRLPRVPRISISWFPCR